MSKGLETIQADLDKKDQRINKLKESRDNWRDKYYYERDYGKKNTSEAEVLEKENTKLQSENISLRRKLRKIEKALKE